MASFDTLILLDTLTFLSSAGSNRQNINMEVRSQYEYKSFSTARIQESPRVHRLLRSLQSSRR